MRRETVVAAVIGLTICISGAFAAVPESYDYVIGEYDEVAIAEVPFDRYLSFDYWFSGDSLPSLPASLHVTTSGFGPDNVFEPVMPVDSIPLNGIASNTWIGYTVDVPTSLYLDPQGNRREGIEEYFAFELSRDFGAFSYLRNVRTFGGNGGDGGGSDQPVPEPGTLTMIGTGLMAVLGYRIRKKHTVA